MTFSRDGFRTLGLLLGTNLVLVALAAVLGGRDAWWSMLPAFLLVLLVMLITVLVVTTSWSVHRRRWVAVPHNVAMVALGAAGVAACWCLLLTGRAWYLAHAGERVPVMVTGANCQRGQCGPDYRIADGRTGQNLGLSIECSGHPWYAVGERTTAVVDPVGWFAPSVAGCEGGTRLPRDAARVWLLSTAGLLLLGSVGLRADESRDGVRVTA